MALAQVFGIRVRQLRKSRGWNQESLAHAVGLAVTYLGQIERGQRNPSLAVVERFAQVFQVEAVSLLIPAPCPPDERTAPDAKP